MRRVALLEQLDAFVDASLHGGTWLAGQIGPVAQHDDDVGFLKMIAANNQRIAGQQANEAAQNRQHRQADQNPQGRFAFLSHHFPQINVAAIVA